MIKKYTLTELPYVTVVEIPKDKLEKIDMALCKQPKQTLVDYYNDCNKKPDLIINGGFFDMPSGSTIFTYKDNGIIVSSNSNYKEGIGITKNGEMRFGNVNESIFTDFVCGYPVLIKEGKACRINIAQEINYKARRTILAYNKSTIFAIAVETPGMTFVQMQKLLISLGVDYAINLDGGSSTKFLQNGISITKNITNRAVDNVVCFYLDKTIYRVQVGAFSSKERAETLLKEIKDLGGTYKQAYIKLVGSLYKVQVGAFSVKENAINLLKDLESKGFKAFITK